MASNATQIVCGVSKLHNKKSLSKAVVPLFCAPSATGMNK